MTRNNKNNDIITIIIIIIIIIIIYRLFTDSKIWILKKILYPMYILFVYKKELSKNDYLKTLLITIIKSLKKII